MKHTGRIMGIINRALHMDGTVSKELARKVRDRGLYNHDMSVGELYAQMLRDGGDMVFMHDGAAAAQPGSSDTTSVDNSPGGEYNNNENMLRPHAAMDIREASKIDDLESSDGTKQGNYEVRKWYIEQVSNIPKGINPDLPVEEQAKNAFEARNNLRTKARSMMADEETRRMLEAQHPNKSFEELVESKMRRKGMTREEAIKDVLFTATSTNKSVNAELGMGGE